MSYFYHLFIKGLFTVLPITLTLYLLYWLTVSVESLLNQYVVVFIPDFLHFPGMGIIAGVALLTLVGLLMNHFVSDRVSEIFEAPLNKVPLIKTVYKPLRDLMQLFAKKPDQNMQRVVLVTLPALNIKILGLVTRDQFDDLPKDSIPEDHIAVFAPGSYFFGGVTLIVPKHQLEELDMPVEQAVKLAITGWIQGDLTNGQEAELQQNLAEISSTRGDR